ncbi:unnamed protein product [Rhodiola kirilowii]
MRQLCQGEATDRSWNNGFIRQLCQGDTSYNKSSISILL